MKLTYFQLGPHLTKKLAPVYIVSGEEFLLKQDAIQLIRTAANKAGFAERTRLLAESGFNWDELYPFLYEASLLTNKRVLELNLCDATPNKIGSRILCDYLSRPIEDNLLLIDMGKLDAKITKSAWYQALEKAGVVVTIWPVPQDKLPLWIMERANQAGLTLSRDAAVMLSDYTEGNLSSAAQAIEKLCLLHMNKPIDGRIIAAALEDESRFNIFDLIENLIADNKERALHILTTLKANGTDPVLVLWVLTRELRLLDTIANEHQTGASYEQLFQKHRIFARRQAVIRRFLSTTSEQTRQTLLSRAAHIDHVIKGAVAGNAWHNLELLCLSFS